MNANEIFLKNLNASIESKKQLSSEKDFHSTLSAVSLRILNSYKKEGRLLVAGNGGSAADSQHFVAELVSRLNFDRDPLPAEALTVDSSVITAISNDYGYEQVFSRQIQAKARKADVFFGISTSGNSKNLVEAFKTCNLLGITSVLLTGNRENFCEKIASYTLKAPSNSTPIIQECHILIYHSICEFLENELFDKT